MGDMILPLRRRDKVFSLPAADLEHAGRVEGLALTSSCGCVIISRPMGKDFGEPYEFKDTYQFRFTRKIADGGMGSIYESQLFGSEGFEKTVTIKTIREKFTGDRDFVDMFIGEAKLVADLVHQNIVQIYKLGRIGNQYYIAMEYVNGINLQEFL